MRRILFLLMLLMPLMAASETGQILVETDLMKEPFSDAESLAKLPAKTAVEVVKRHGGWIQVKPEKMEAKGWVKLFAVKLGGSGDAAKGDTGLSELWNVAATGHSGNTKGAVATGVRGLTPEDVKQAKPAPEEVKKLDGFEANKSQATSEAKSAHLTKKKVDYLAEAKGGRK